MTLPSSFQPETPEEAQERQEADLQAAHGDLASQVQTVGESMGDTATFGLFGHALNALGGDPTARAERAEANPVAHGLGIAGGLLLPGGAAKVIGRAGAGAAAVAEGLLPEATSFLGKVARTGVKGLTSGAVEGGLFSAGNVVSEAALDPNLTAESAAEEIGLGTLLGGGIGGGLGALGGLAKGVAGGSLGKKIAEWLPEFEGERNIKAAGATQSDFTSAEAKVGRDELRKIGREAGELGLVEPFDSAGKVLTKSQDLMKSAGGRMGEALQGADAAGAKPLQVGELADRIQKEALGPLGKNPFARSAIKGVEDTLGAYREQFGDALSFRDLHGIRMNIGDELYGLSGDKTPAATHAKAAWKKAYGIISEELEGGLKASGLDAKPWLQANREYQVASSMARFAKKGTQRAAGNNPLGPLSVLSGLTGFATHGLGGGALMGLGAEAAKRYSSSLLAPAARGLRQAMEAGALGAAPETVGALSHLAAANEAVAARVDSMVGKVLQMPVRATRGAPGAAGATVAHMATAQGRIEQIQRLAGNPEAMQQALVAHAGDLHEHAPETAQALQVQRSRQVSFLASKIPQMPPPTPLGPKMKPTHEQAWKFNRYFEAVERPTSILKHAAAGTLTPMDVEAVRETSPTLHQKMVSAALEQVAARKEPLPYRAKLSLSMLVGGDLDGTLSPKSIEANQMAYALPSSRSGDDMAAPRQPGAVRPSQTGLGKLNVSNRAALPGQARDARMGEM